MPVFLLLLVAMVPLRWEELRPGVQALLEKAGVRGSGFAAFRESLAHSTASRLAEGENDHLVFFVLQSRAFTSRPRIEPALSARSFVESMPPAGREKYLAGEPAAAKPGGEVTARIDEFVAALRNRPSDDRMRYFARQPGITRDMLLHEYARAMRWVYRKEFGGGAAGPLYQARGHSSDTRMEANYAVWNGLRVLHAMDPKIRFSRVMIAGPGLDFAPRTALVDEVPPQSYQPFAIADALLDLGLAGEDWRVDCADVNPRVVGWFRSAPSRLILFAEAAGGDYREYFERAGKAIGRVENQGARKTIDLAPGLAARVSAERMNILTEHYASPRYDLVVATNIFVYFSPAELALALSSLRSMMRDGGYLIHNELRPECDEVAQAAGFQAVQARSLRIAGDLYDAFALYRADASSRSSKSPR